MPLEPRVNGYRIENGNLGYADPTEDEIEVFNGLIDSNNDIPYYQSFFFGKRKFLDEKIKRPSFTVAQLTTTSLWRIQRKEYFLLVLLEKVHPKNSRSSVLSCDTRAALLFVLEAARRRLLRTFRLVLMQHGKKLKILDSPKRCWT